MATYKITEKQNLQSIREGYEFKGTLRAAKAHATLNQVFHGTVLTIDHCGVLIAIKRDGVWTTPN